MSDQARELVDDIDTALVGWLAEIRFHPSNLERRLLACRIAVMVEDVSLERTTTALNELSAQMQATVTRVFSA